MAILRASDVQQLTDHFQKNLVSEVTVDFFTQKSLLYIPGRECPTCAETGQLLEEVTGLSEKLRLQVTDFYKQTERAVEMGIDRIPAFVLRGSARGKVRYFGIPAGNEFPALVADLVDVSRGETALSEETRKALGTLSQEVHLQVFVTPT
jgi:alkyl hydroperoxide reductase subunit AhpF